MRTPIIQVLREKYGPQIEEEIYREYVLEKKTVQRIAYKYGVSREPIKKLLQSIGADIRSGPEALKIWWENLTEEERRKQVAAAHKKNKQLASKGELSFQKTWKNDRERMLEQVKNNALKTCKIRKRNGMTGKTGPKHHLWNGKKTKEERVKFRKTEEHYAWVRAVYEKDGYICQVCGYSKGGTLNAHHLNSYADNIALRLDVSNGVTLCKTCHMDFHGIYGYGQNTAEQFYEYCATKQQSIQAFT